MSGVIRWEEPPATTSARAGLGQSRSALAPIADALVARPGEWAVVFEGRSNRATSMATHIRLGQVICFSPCGDFDATTRVVDGQTIVYARYVGEPS